MSGRALSWCRAIRRSCSGPPSPGCLPSYFGTLFGGEFFPSCLPTFATQRDRNLLEGLFLVRVDHAHLCWQHKKPYLELRFVVLQPAKVAKRTFYGRLYCTEKAVPKLSWFLRDFGYDSELLKLDQRT
jgi:hypothetical protein